MKTEENAAVCDAKKLYSVECEILWGFGIAFFGSFSGFYKHPQSWNIFGCSLEWKCDQVALHGGGKVMTRG